MTATATAAPDTATAALPKCRICRGPVLFYAGSVNGYTCRKCLAAYVEDQIHRHDRRTKAESRRRREALAAKIAATEAAAAATDTESRTA